MTGEKITVKFYGIDYWNRPVFVDKNQNFYGSTDILFNSNVSPKEVLDSISEKDLTYFGRDFDGDPIGTPVKNIKIER